MTNRFRHDKGNYFRKETTQNSFEKRAIIYHEDGNLEYERSLHKKTN